ncbi:50S ribosomal protein L33 [Candidatus Vidania fulgoroideorum]
MSKKKKKIFILFSTSNSGHFYSVKNKNLKKIKKFDPVFRKYFIYKK